jgi:hypothetical protein
MHIQIDINNVLSHVINGIGMGQSSHFVGNIVHAQYCKSNIPANKKYNKTEIVLRIFFLACPSYYKLLHSIFFLKFELQATQDILKVLLGYE